MFCSTNLLFLSSNWSINFSFNSSLKSGLSRKVLIACEFRSLLGRITLSKVSSLSTATSKISERSHQTPNPHFLFPTLNFAINRLRNTHFRSHIFLDITSTFSNFSCVFVWIHYSSYSYISTNEYINLTDPPYLTSRIWYRVLNN